MLTLDVSNTFQVSGLTRQFKKDIFSHHSQNISRHNCTQILRDASQICYNIAKFLRLPFELKKDYVNLILTVP